MSGLRTRMNRIELRTHKILTRTDWRLLAGKWKSRLEVYDAVPEDLKQEALDAKMRRDEIDTSEGFDEYRVFLIHLMKEAPQIYCAMMYFTAMEVAGRGKGITWIRNSKRSNELFLELSELRKCSER